MALAEAPYTIAECAKRWKECEETVKRRIRRGELACLRLSKRKILVPASAVVAYEQMVGLASSDQARRETLTASTGRSPTSSDETDDPEAASSRRMRLKRRARATR